MDPYCLKKDNLLYTSDTFPNVSIIDIYELPCFNTQLLYPTTNESIQKFGVFVKHCGVKCVGDYAVVVGKVNHSQQMNKPPLNVWLICKIDGSVSSAHCTCMAGAGKVCSHVGAILYTLESITKGKESVSCTDTFAA